MPDDYLSRYDADGALWISTSMLTDYILCGIHCHRTYLEREREPRAVRVSIGIGTHKGRELNLKQKVETQEDLPVDESTDAARDKVNEEFEEFEIITLDDEFEGKSKKDARGLAVDIAASLAEADREEFQPGIIPAAVETSLRVEFPGFGREVVGTIDVWDIDDDVHDLKTSKRAKNQRAADTNKGFTTYGMLKLCTDGKLPKKYHMENCVAGKKGVRTLSFETTRTEAQMNQMIARYALALEGMEKGVFQPADPEFSWKCSEAYCGFWPTCKFGGKK
jgi:hypothetical protein